MDKKLNVMKEIAYLHKTKVYIQEVEISHNILIKQYDRAEVCNGLCNG